MVKDASVRRVVEQALGSTLTDPELRHLDQGGYLEPVQRAEQGAVDQAWRNSSSL